MYLNLDIGGIPISEVNNRPSELWFRPCWRVPCRPKIALFLEIAEESFRIGICPVRQQDDIIAVKLDCVLTDGIDDDRSDQSRLLLEAAVAVIPVSAVLHHRKLVMESFAGRDAGKA